MTELPATQAADWEQRYREGRTGGERGGLNPAFLAFLADGTLAPGRILVPGAGRSHEPLALARAGFQVVALDISPSAVAAQQERLAGTPGRAELADLFTWEPEMPLDAVYDQTCLCALPPALLDAYAARLARWVRPGGVLAALFMQTGRPGGPPYHCDLHQMRALFPDDAWAWPEIPHPMVAHPGGTAEIPVALVRL
ncbi:MAG: methyltransferase domain-containing protein [Rhodospirillales bacterium]|nr:methyltransferase domain-containing protein [Rhodospirillales bacterium]